MTELLSIDEHDEILRIGRVISVKGRRVRVAVEKEKNASHLIYKGHLIRNVAVSRFVKISKGFVDLVAIVEGEEINEDKSSSPSYRKNTDTLRRELDLGLIGYIENGKICRGIRELPLLDNECFLLTPAELQGIYSFAADSDESVHIGTLAMDPTQPISIGADAIFASHIGIFGNTGSGKSYTLAKLYHALFQSFAGSPGFAANSRFLIIDFNGEYVDIPASEERESSTKIIANREKKYEYKLSTRSHSSDKLPLPISVVEDISFWTVLLDATEKTQAPFLSRVLTNTFWEDRFDDQDAMLSALADLVQRATKSSDITIDRLTIINLLKEVDVCLAENAPKPLRDLIDEFQTNLHYHSTNRKFYWGNWGPGNYVDSDHDTWISLTSDKVAALQLDFSQITGIDRTRLKIVLQYYSDVISGFSNRDHLAPLIKRLETRVPDIKKMVEVRDDFPNDRPLTVVSLRDVNLAMRKTVPMILCKFLYDNKKMSDPSNQTHLNLVIDEAHNILSSESARESELWRDYRLETFEEIIKEGRKFGVFLTIASQRPHDISPTIISQLHNYFLHRLVNELDIRAIERAVAYLDRVNFEALPILPTGACILAGVSAQVPVIIQITGLPDESEPNSKTMSLTKLWATEPSQNLTAALDDVPF